MRGKTEREWMKQIAKAPANPNLITPQDRKRDYVKGEFKSKPLAR